MIEELFDLGATAAIGGGGKDDGMGFLAILFIVIMVIALPLGLISQCSQPKVPNEPMVYMLDDGRMLNSIPMGRLKTVTIMSEMGTTVVVKSVKNSKTQNMSRAKFNARYNPVMTVAQWNLENE